MFPPTAGVYVTRFVSQCRRVSNNLGNRVEASLCMSVSTLTLQFCQRLPRPKSQCDSPTLHGLRGPIGSSISVATFGPLQPPSVEETTHSHLPPSLPQLLASGISSSVSPLSCMLHACVDVCGVGGGRSGNVMSPDLVGRQPVARVCVGPGLWSGVGQGDWAGEQSPLCSAGLRRTRHVFAALHWCTLVRLCYSGLYISVAGQGRSLSWSRLVYT